MKISWTMMLFLVACASRPQLYPNEHLKRVGKTTANADTDRCIAEAENYLESSKGKKIAKGAGSGAVIGAAVGAVSGLFTGDFGGSLVRGSAVGAGAGAVSGSLSPDVIKERYVNQCLTEKGYQVLGWE